MREIKFRAWTGLKMEYDVVAGQLGTFYVAGLDPEDTSCLSPYNTIYDKSTPIMQFTGLHDKNEKEIYEGDIVNFHDEICQILWEESGACFYISTIRDDQNEWIDRFNLNISKNCEVIGNIYENPELLGEVKA